MLPKINRLTKEEDFRKVFRSGKRMTGSLFDLFVVKKPKESDSRFGFVVSNKVSKKAVERNRAKRLLRESVFGLPKTYFYGHDCIVSAKNPIIVANRIIINNEINHLFEMLTIHDNESIPS